MNSSLKYRGKSVCNGKWVYGGLYNSGCLVSYRENKYNIDTIFTEIKEGILDQFVGLYDKNKKEIYENDILIIRNKRTDEKIPRAKILIVKYDRLKNKTIGISRKDITSKKYEVEVVGNIHDNIRRENEEAVLWL